MNTNSTPNTPHLPSNLNGTTPNGTPPVSPVMAPAAHNGAVTRPLHDAADSVQADQSRSVTKPGLLRRLAAQWRTPKQAARGEAWEHDPIARPRDKHENPQQREIVFLSPAPGDDRPVAQTPKVEYLALIAATHPLRAKWLHDFYDHSVLPLLKRYQDLVREEWEKLAGINAEVERHNADLEARLADLEVEREDKTLTDRQAILALDMPFKEAQRHAAEKVTRAGGAYDPQNPTPEAVLRQEKRTLEALAGEYGIPWTPGDASRRLPKWFLWALTIGTGIVIGLSLAILGTFLDADAIGAQLFVVLGAGVVGFIVASGSGWAVKHFCRAASERYYLAIYHSRGPLYWVPSLLAATGVIVSVIGMDAAIEFGGLLKAVQLDSATQAGVRSIPLSLAYLVGMVITFGYVLTYGREGALDGRYHPCLNRLLSLQEAEFTARDKEIRARPVVQEALRAIAVVQDVLREKANLEERIEVAAAPFNAAIAQLESLKREPQPELSLEARRRIQDAHDNWVGAHSQYVGHVTAMIKALEPMDAPDVVSPHPAAPIVPAAPRSGFFDWLRGRLGGKRPVARNGLQGTLRP